MKKLFLLLLFTIAATFANAQNNKEEVEAMMISSMTRYIAWENVTGDFNIGVVGNNDVFRNLTKYFAGRKIQGATVVVTQLTNKSDFAGYEILVSNRLHPVQPNLLTIKLDGTEAMMNSNQEDDKIKV